MTVSLSDDQLRRLRLRAQRLASRQPAPAADVAAVAKELCGLQAQDPLAAALAIRARSSGLVARDVERARVDERSVIRTWCLRGTLHLLAAEDLGWLLPLLGPVFVRKSGRRYAELGLDEGTRAKATHVLGQLLSRHSSLARAEIVHHLAARGIALAGQAVPHLLRYAALQGVICHGPEREGEPTYVLLSEWVDYHPTVGRAAALAELARRYLGAYAPAGPPDLAAWSGLPLAEVRPGWQRIADQLLQVQCRSQPAWLLNSQSAWLDALTEQPPLVRLLPSFDTYLLGYRTRDLLVASEYGKRLHPGGGVLHPTLLVNGRAAGTWRVRRQRDHLAVTVEPFEDLADDAQPGLEAEVRDLGRFLGVEARCSVVAPTHAEASH